MFEQGRLAEKSSYVGYCSLPYVSGLFYLREGPFVVEAAKRLKVRPQLLCFDAHGAAHPRSAGLATICGAILGVPSVGMAKSLLVGEIGNRRQGLAEIVYGGRTVGFASKIGGVTRYWSPGYSFGLRGLKSVIRSYAQVCLMAMSESDRAARKQIQSALN